MYILENVPLNAYSTMRLGGSAAFLTDVTSRSDIAESVAWAEERKLPIIMIGSGSNIIWSDKGFSGLVLVNKIMGIEMQEVGDSERYLTAGAGVPWDDLVNYSVKHGLTGIEFLSLIPGTVGATPVQNVGAYGQEVSTSITTIEAYDLQEHRFVMMQGSECKFGYRKSRFNSDDKGRFLITRVTFFLNIGNPMPPYYASAKQYFAEQGIRIVSPQAARNAVVAIRKAKLPDPTLIANNGSFFANPIISTDDFFQLHANFDDLPHWTVDSQHVKIPAAWLIENIGFKDFHDEQTGMATWHAQPLVLINEHAKTTADLIAFKQKIVMAVQNKFGITLNQEPELIGE